ncbi:MAG: hypothetical protein R6W70_07850 [bacterium]
MDLSVIRTLVKPNSASITMKKPITLKLREEIRPMLSSLDVTATVIQLRGA